MNPKVFINKISIFILLLAVLSFFGCNQKDNKSWLSPPQNVVATSNDSEISIEWPEVASAKKYNLYWGASPGVTKDTGTLVEGVVSPFVHTGISNGNPYYYRLNSFNEGGQSGLSAEVVSSPLPLPVYFRALPGVGDVTLDWYTPSGSWSYNVYWLDDGSEVTKEDGYLIGGISEAPYIHTGLANGTWYNYIVTTVNEWAETTESYSIWGTPHKNSDISGFYGRSGAAAGDSFGNAMEFLGDNLAIGARLADPSGVTDGGVVEILTIDSVNGGWITDATLTASDVFTNDEFGTDLSYSDDRMIISSSGADPGAITDAGAAYIFDRDPASGVWSESVKISASDRAANDRFGMSVDIDGDTAIVGAPLADPSAGTDAGVVYIFDRDPATGVWSESVKLTPSDQAAGDNFGWKTKLWGDIALISGDHTHGGVKKGAVYVFSRDPNTGSWNEDSEILASDGAAGDFFGASLDFDGRHLLVGANNADPDLGGGALTNAGAAYLFSIDYSTGVWSEEIKFTSFDATANAVFGSAVTVSGTVIAIGATGAAYGAATNAGAVYLYNFDPNTGFWVGGARLNSSTPEISGTFGASIALGNYSLAVGAPNEDDAPAGPTLTDTGKFHIFN